MKRFLSIIVLVLASCGTAHKTQKTYPVQVSNQIIIHKDISYIEKAHQVAVKMTLSQAVSVDELINVDVYDMSTLLGHLIVLIPKGQTVGFAHLSIDYIPSYLNANVTSVTPDTFNFYVQ